MGSTEDAILAFLDTLMSSADLSTISVQGIRAQLKAELDVEATRDYDKVCASTVQQVAHNAGRVLMMRLRCAGVAWEASRSALHANALAGLSRGERGDPCLSDTATVQRVCVRVFHAVPWSRFYRSLWARLAMCGKFCGPRSVDHCRECTAVYRRQRYRCRHVNDDDFAQNSSSIVFRSRAGGGGVPAVPASRMAPLCNPVVDPLCV